MSGTNPCVSSVSLQTCSARFGRPKASPYGHQSPEISLYFEVILPPARACIVAEVKGGERPTVTGVGVCGGGKRSEVNPADNNRRRGGTGGG